LQLESTIGIRRFSSPTRPELNWELPADFDKLVVGQLQIIANTCAVATHDSECHAFPDWQALAVISSYGGLTPDIVGDISKIEIASQGSAACQNSQNIRRFHEAVICIDAPKIRSFLRDSQTICLCDARHRMNGPSQHEHVLLQGTISLNDAVGRLFVPRPADRWGSA